MKEPEIIINGKVLTIGQAMTVRVALGSFAISLNEGLGEDEHGRRMTAAYRERLRELFAIMGVSG